MKVTEEFKKEITPFFWSEYGDAFSVCLNAGDYKQEVLKFRGAMGSGYDWENIARAFLEDQCPDFIEKIQFDSEAGMFCVCSKDAAVLQEFVSRFKKICEDAPSMSNLLDLTELN